MNDKRIDAAQVAHLLCINYNHAVWLMRKGAFKTAAKTLHNTRIKWFVDEAEVMAVRTAWLSPNTERLDTRQIAVTLNYAPVTVRTMVLRGEWATARKELLPLSKRAEWTVERQEIEEWAKRKEVQR